MKILPVSDPSFQNYGQVLTGYDLKELLETLDKVTPCPDGVDYVPEQAELQALPIEKELRNNAYGGMPIQLGWCNGHNTKMNCLEYHRDSELNVGTQDFILLLAKREEGPGLQGGHRAAEGNEPGQARNHRQERGGRDSVGSQQMAAGPRGFLRGGPGREGADQGREPGHRRPDLISISKGRCVHAAPFFIPPAAGKAPLCARSAGGGEDG